MRDPLLSRAYDAYSFSVIPAMGGLVAGDRASYAYLVESIRQFPDQVGWAGSWQVGGRMVDVVILLLQVWARVNLAT